MYRTPQTAILLATYNGENFISEQIDSILAQSDKEWELFIHDDGSKDGTVEILDAYAKQYPDKIHVLEAPSTGGAKQNFLYLFSQVEAPYYMCADQDDVWLPEKIRLTKEEMLRLESGETEIPTLVFTELTVVDGDLNVLSEKMSTYQGLDCAHLSLNRMLIQNVVTGCTMMVNKTLRDELGKITDATDVQMHDWWAMLVAARFGKVAFLDTPTILYRQHGNNGVGAQNSNSFMYMIKRMFQGDEIKVSLENTRKQAAYFAKVYAEVFQKEKTSIVAQYADLGEKGKLSRLWFYFRNDVKKSTWSKNLGLMLWG